MIRESSEHAQWEFDLEKKSIAYNLSEKDSRYFKLLQNNSILFFCVADFKIGKLKIISLKGYENVIWRKTYLNLAHVSSNLPSIWRFWISSARFLLLDPDQTWRGNHYFRWRNPPNLLELCGPWVWRPNKNFRKKYMCYSLVWYVVYITFYLLGCTVH